jgi:uncharacterized membrane protein YqhA
MLKPLLNASRFLVLAAVVGSLAGAAALFVYGLVDTVVIIARTIANGEVSTTGAKQVMLYFIEIFRFIPARHRDADHGTLPL